MPRPKTVKEVQSLNGKLAAMSRYLSSSASKSLPFFKTLKNCLSKKDFRWTTEAENAFTELKVHLASLPMLTTPIIGEELYMYLAATDRAVSSVLMAERDKVQAPIYFVSRVLHGPEENYSPMEKLALALVYAARRLRRYFQAHKVNVLTDQPIRQVLHKPEISGRLAKWAIELGEHGISYIPRTSVKGQILADFFAELPQNQLALTQVVNEASVENITKVADEGKWVMYTDGASNSSGAGAGLILTDPDGVEYTYALRFNFNSSNNESEYEALLAGLRIATAMEVRNLQVYVDSKLVSSQINGEYEARDANMKKYMEKAKELISSFKSFGIQQVPRSENKKADALSKLASVAFAHLTKKVLVETLERPSIDEQEVLAIVEEHENTWMTPIVQYLVDGTLPQDPSQARKVRVKAPNYNYTNGILYKRSYLVPWLRCIGPQQAEYVIREIHEGACGMHSGPRSVVAKVMNMGYFWPSMHRDALTIIQKCNSCQVNAPINRQPQTDMISVTAPWPFQKWAMDIVGPFPMAQGQLKFLIVAIDYFTKWVEAKPVKAITGAAVKKFVWENIVCRYGLPHEMVTDNGAQFAGGAFKSWCAELKINQIFTSVAHPQANGQVERANRSIVEGIKLRLEGQGNDWLDNLSHVLWAHRTMVKTSNGETPFSLTYGTEAVLPAEIGVPTWRTANPEENGSQDLRLNLELLEERREIAAIRECRNKQQMAKYYNSRVKPTSFVPGDYVLRKNEASKAQPEGKLGPKWEGPYQVVASYGNGSYELAKSDGTSLPRSWNVANLRKCYL